MSEYELLPDEAFEGAPADPHEKFNALVRIAQSNLARLLDQTQSSDFATEIRAQFVSSIIAIAEALGIEGLPPMKPEGFGYDEYQTFQVYLAGVTAKVRLQSHLVPRPHSVELGKVSKARLHQEIEQLRRFIAESDLSDGKKKQLNARLDELEIELSKKRVAFAKVMAVAASIMGVVGGTTATLANLPEASMTILTVIRVLGEEKEKEDEERLRLSPPPKALPDLTEKPRKVTHSIMMISTMMFHSDSQPAVTVVGIIDPLNECLASLG